MRRALIVLTIIVVIVASLVGTYFYFSGKEYVFRFSEAQLHEQLAKRLPIQKRYLLIFEVILNKPRLSLVNGSNRVNAGLDVMMNIHLGNEPLSLGGTIDISGGIRYDNKMGRFFLTDPVIEHLDLEGIPEQYAKQANTVMTDALQAYYAEHPIYTLRASDAKQVAAWLVLKNVIVQNKELVIILGI